MKITRTCLALLALLAAGCAKKAPEPVATPKATQVDDARLANAAREPQN